jgi:hypothetical protein
MSPAIMIIGRTIGFNSSASIHPLRFIRFDSSASIHPLRFIRFDSSASRLSTATVLGDRADPEDQ